MKILFVEPNENTLLSFRKELVDWLIEEGHSVFLCVKQSKSINELYRNKAKEIINIDADLQNTNPFSNIGLLLKYKKTIKRISPDLILSFTIKPNIYCGFSGKKTIMIANITGLGTLFNKKGILKMVGTFLYKRSFKNVNCIMFQNANDYQMFKSLKIKINSFQIIPGSGVNIEKFKRQNSMRIPQSFLYVSRPITEKGFDLLVDCLPDIIQEFPNSKFTFLVDKLEVKNKKFFECLNNYPKNIDLIDRTFNLVDYYCKHSFLVSPSFYHEGVSNVLLESLACETPIITTNDNPGCMELLDDNKNGFGVVSNDRQSLIEALRKACNLSNDEICAMGEKGRLFVSNKYDRKLVINAYSKAIKGLIEG